MRHAPIAFVLLLATAGCDGGSEGPPVADDDTAPTDDDAAPADDDTAPEEDVTPPYVRITEPTDAYVDGVVQIAATAEDASGIDRVELWVDDVLLTEDGGEPYEAPWDTAPYAEGPHVVRAVAWDGAGLSATAEMEVQVDRSPPQVEIASPPDGGEVDGAGTVLVRVEVEDASPVAQVEIAVDGTPVATLESQPFEYAWEASTAAHGHHEIGATATDALGHQGSATVRIRVDTDVPIAEPASLVGRAYVVDLAGGTIVEPAGIGALLALEDYTMLLEPTELDEAAGTIRIRAAMADASGEQDLCQPTVELGGETGGTFDNPDFEIGPSGLEYEADGLSVDLEELMVRGEFSADGAAIQELDLLGLLDTRPVDALIGGGTGATCDLLAALAIACEPCPADGEDFCVSLRVEDLAADHRPGTSVVPRTEDEIASDPGC